MLKTGYDSNVNTFVKLNKVPMENFRIEIADISAFSAVMIFVFQEVATTLWWYFIRKPSVIYGHPSQTAGDSS